MEKNLLSIGEYPSFYEKYIAQVPENSLADALVKGKSKMLDFLRGMPNDRLAYRYAEGKWSPKQVLLHVSDTERVFSYRALFFARSNENHELKGFDETVFAENSNADERSWEELLKNYLSVREATIHLFKSFRESDFHKYGRVNGHKLSVGAIGFILCGHENHHREIIRNRYL